MQVNYSFSYYTGKIHYAALHVILLGILAGDVNLCLVAGRQLKELSALISSS
jgi:hypothetical protein